MSDAGGGELSSPEQQALRVLESLRDSALTFRRTWAREEPMPLPRSQRIRDGQQGVWSKRLSHDFDWQLTVSQERFEALMRDYFCYAECLGTRCEAAIAAIRWRAGSAEPVAECLARAFGDVAESAQAALLRRRRRSLAVFQAVQAKLGGASPDEPEEPARLTEVEIEVCRERGLWWSSGVKDVGDDLLEQRRMLELAVRGALAGQWPGQLVAPSLGRLRDMVVGLVSAALEESRFNARVLTAIGDPHAQKEERQRWYREFRTRNSQRRDYILT